ncbi:MAG: hypothetical protein ACK5NL_17580, partial [Vibrio fluvialis]
MEARFPLSAASTGTAVDGASKARDRGRAGGVVREFVRNLYPGYFALVMATGIVSNGLFLLGHETLSAILFVIALLAFVVLLGLTLYRAASFPGRFWGDLVDPRLVFSFFTVVAAIN